MNPFINAQGYALDRHVHPSPSAQLQICILDPLFIFVFGLGVRGAAVATVLSQLLSACVRPAFPDEKGGAEGSLSDGKQNSPNVAATAKNIVSLGTSGFVMQLTNSLSQRSAATTSFPSPAVISIFPS